MRKITQLKKLLNRISLTCLDKTFNLILNKDKKGGNRLYIQIEYSNSCTKTHKIETWKGRKWYLSDHMTNDEVIKTVYAAFEAAVKHEIMEGFKIDNKVLFNPHINFEELIKISDQEIFRK